MLNMNNNRLIINPNTELNTYETSRIIIHAVIKLSVHRTISKTILVLYNFHAIFQNLFRSALIH